LKNRGRREKGGRKGAHTNRRDSAKPKLKGETQVGGCYLPGGGKGGGLRKLEDRYNRKGWRWVSRRTEIQKQLKAEESCLEERTFQKRGVTRGMRKLALRRIAKTELTTLILSKSRGGGAYSDETGCTERTGPFFGQRRCGEGDGKNEAGFPVLANRTR